MPKPHFTIFCTRKTKDISYETIHVFLNRICKSGAMISQQKQPIIGYLNEDGKSNFKSLTRRIQFYSAVQCCLGQYNGDPRDLIVHLYSYHTKSIPTQFKAV